MISRRVWIIMIIITLAYALGIALDITPLLRGPEDWRWPRVTVQDWDRIWPVVVAGLATLGWTVALARLLIHARQRRRWLVVGLLGLMIAAGVVQLLALRMERADVTKALFWRATDFYANGYFTVGAGIADVGEFLRQYPTLMPGFPLHPQVHPPGLPLIYWLTGQIFAAVPGAAPSMASTLRLLDCNNFLIVTMPAGPLSGAVAGFGLPVLANALIVLCVYHMTRSRFGQQAGFMAAACWVLVPSAVIFAGSWSQLYPLLACLTWITFDTGLRRRRVAWFVLAGFLLSVSTFMELGTAALALFMVVYVLAGYVVERDNPLRDWKFLGMALIAGLAGVFSVWLAYRLFYGVSLNDIVAAMWPIHTGYKFDRLTWMINHPYEFSVFVGLPLAILILASWWRALQCWRRRQAADPLSLVVAVSLVLLSVIDPARDETARTWMIFMPLVVVVAAQWLSADQALSRHQLVGIWLLLGVQVLAMLLFMRFIALTPVPEVEVKAASLPADVLPAAAEFGGVQLQGYRFERVADQLLVDLYWQPRLPADYPYSIFVHVIDEQGNLIGQHDTWPQPYLTCWQPGSFYLDRHILTLPPDRVQTALRLSVGLYNAETGRRVPTITAGRESDQTILALPNLP